MNVLTEINVERKRQIAHGYESNHDDLHTEGEILHAVLLVLDDVAREGPTCTADWPLKLSQSLSEKYSANKKRRLIIAAAMLVAEIERMDRCE